MTAQQLIDILKVQPDAHVFAYDGDSEQMELVTGCTICVVNNRIEICTDEL